MAIFDLFRHKKIKSADVNGAEDGGRLLVYIATDTGRIRQNNEDNFFADAYGIRKSEKYSDFFEIDADQLRVFAVCDGMGGESYGDKASEIAATAFGDHVQLLRGSDGSDLNTLMDRYAADANNRVCDMIDEMKCSRSGSTAAIACIRGNAVYAFNIGDSRVYYFDGKTLTQVTEDQTLAMKKLKANIYTEEEARNSRDTHKITSYIGVDDRRIGLHALNYPPFALNDGVVLICSDGLTDMCSDEEIADILSGGNGSPAELLVSRALSNGGADNVTCIVIGKCRG